MCCAVELRSSGGAFGGTLSVFEEAVIVLEHVRVQGGLARQGGAMTLYDRARCVGSNVVWEACASQGWGGAVLLLQAAVFNCTDW